MTRIFVQFEYRGHEIKGRLSPIDGKPFCFWLHIESKSLHEISGPLFATLARVGNKWRLTNFSTGRATDDYSDYFEEVLINYFG